MHRLASELGGLNEVDFVRIAKQGLGDPLNSYAHVMGWFQNQLYLGTTRANLCLITLHDPSRLAPWPIRCPPDPYDLDLRAQIWRYDVQAGRWKRVFNSPQVTGLDGRLVAREYGYRGMALFKSPSDTQEALYISNWAAGRAGQPPLVIRTRDGVMFTALASIGADPTVQSYRALIPLNGCLYTSPTGKVRGRPNVSEDATVLETVDPASLPWSAISPLGFGDGNNLTVFEMAAFMGSLYVGTLNPIRGFQIWKTRPDGQAPYQWVKVLEDGAYRGHLNEGVCSMCVFNDALYVGTAIQNGGYDRAYGVGPAAAELIRIHPDDSWDLIVGSSRLTPAGFKVPLSGHGPGFDDFFNCYIWRMASHDRWLYASTFNWRPYVPYLNLQRWPAHIRDDVFRLGVNSAIKGDGGFHLWRTRDGINWTPVTRNGFGNPYNCGARTLVSSPHGLFVGTANPFGPDVAVKTQRGWEYVPNPDGGLEVWLGAPPRLPAMPRRPLTVNDDRPDGASSFAMRSSPESLTGRVNQAYDDAMYQQLRDEYYGGSDFFNFGLWYHDTQTQKDASENLMEALLGYIPQKTGTILDVACGKGATTRHLLRYYPAANVTGINISERQLASCRQNAPRCQFFLMDATNLAFADESFDAVICVEAAFHFKTRAQFLQEAHRVLKKGGRLVLSDILVFPLAERLSRVRSAENYLPGIDAYRAALAAAGFGRAAVFDATRECKVPFYQNVFRFLDLKFRRHEIDEPTYFRVVDSNSLASAAIRVYLLAWACKE